MRCQRPVKSYSQNFQDKLIVMVWLALPAGISAQNLQLHYDFGRERHFATATLEMFRPDTMGATFWFVDFDFDFTEKPRSMSAAYWEIARDFYIPGLRKMEAFDQLGFHIEYNDGFTAYTDTGGYTGAASYNPVWLAGFSHPVVIANATLTAQLLLRLPRGMHSPDFQVTIVWFQSFLKNRLLFAGFADLWTQNRLQKKNNKEMVFQTEPQLWCIVSPHFSLGSEIEISYNFPYGPEPWTISPTLAVRWEF